MEMLRIITHSLMVHAIVLEAYIHFALMIMTDHIFLFLLTKDLINKDGEPITSFKLATGIKPSVSNLRVLFLNVLYGKLLHTLKKKALNVCHQAQKGFCGIFVGIPHHQKGYLVYVPSIRMLTNGGIIELPSDSSPLSALSQVSDNKFTSSKCVNL